MEKQIVNPPNLVSPRGFSHGIVTSGGRLFLAGQDATGREGHLVGPGDLVAQFDQVLSNIREVVVTAGGRMQDIVKLNIYVRSRDDYAANRHSLGKVWSDYLGDYYPAMALFEVASLFVEEALVEIEGIAVLKETEAK